MNAFEIGLEWGIIRTEETAKYLENADKPVYGEMVTLIHPYDAFDIMYKNPGHNWEKIGETGIPVEIEDGKHYLSRAPIYSYCGKLYVETTAVPFKTNAFADFYATCAKRYSK